MRIVFTVFFLLSYSVLGQTFSVFNINTDEFPIVKAKFWAFDSLGNQMTDFSIDDFNIYEDGIQREVIDVTCTETKVDKLSITMSIDISGSMGGRSDISPINLGKTTINRLCDQIPMPPNEAALLICDSHSSIIQDFTTDRKLIRNGLLLFESSGGTNIYEQLLNSNTGLIHVAKRGKYKKVAIIYTDGYWSNMDNNVKECIELCRNNSIQFFAIIYSESNSSDIGVKSSLKTIADSTYGMLYDGITESEAIDDLVNRIIRFAYSSEPCEITWKSDISCQEDRNLRIECLPINKVETNVYSVPDELIAKIAYKYSIIRIGNIEPGQSIDTSLVITAINSSFNITDIISSNPDFDINPKSFLLDSGKSKELTITFTPEKSGLSYVEFQFIAAPCNFNYYAIGGERTLNSNGYVLKVVHPNGGEVFLAGADTLVTWEGLMEQDSVDIELSTDNGISWSIIAKETNGLKFDWNKIQSAPSKECLIRITELKPIQDKYNPEIQWQRCLGSGGEANCNQFITLADGNCLILSGKGIFKLDKNGNTLWVRDIYYYRGIEKNDGSFNFGRSNKGVVEIAHALDDGRVVEMKNFSGNGSNDFIDIKNTYDGGNIIAMSSSSSDGIFRQNKGGYDYYLIKTDENMNVQWVKNYGGSKDDKISCIDLTIDGGFIIAGVTSSEDGDIGNKIESSKFWIIKVDYSGQLVWNKLIDRDSYIEIHDIKVNDFGNIYLCGIKSRDFFLIKLNSNGKIIFKKNYGGSGYDCAYSLVNSYNDGCTLGGFTFSNDGDVHNNWGYSDFWIVNIDKDGNILWEKNLGGPKWDRLTAIGILQDGGIIAGGPSSSYYGDVKAHGRYSFWVAKLYPEELPGQMDVSDSLFSIVTPVVESFDIDMKQVLVGSNKDSLITDFVINTGEWPCRIDSIYFKIGGGIFSVVSGFPKYTVGVGASHFCEIRFSPKKAILYEAEMIIISQSDTLRHKIFGEGIEPKLEILNNLIDFGQVVVGENKDTLQITTIKNIGDSPVRITKTKYALQNEDEYSTISGGGPFVINPGQEWLMDLRFSPVRSGRKSGLLEFYFDGLGSPAKLQLFGEGIVVPKISATFAGFGNLLCESAVYSNIYIENIGQDTLVVKDINISGINEEDFVVNEIFPFKIEPDSSKNVNILFRPSTTGEKEAELSIYSNSYIDSILNIPITGRKDSVNIHWKDDIIDLGTVNTGETIDTTIQLINNGTIRNTAFVDGSGVFDFNSDRFVIAAEDFGNLKISFPGIAYESIIDENLNLIDSICKRESNIRILLEVVKEEIPLAVAQLKIPDKKAETGEIISVPIFLENIENQLPEGINSNWNLLIWNIILLYYTQLIMNRY